MVGARVGVPGDTAPGRSALTEGVLETGPLGAEGVPRAAGIEDAGRGADGAALRGVAGAGGGASTAITTESPTNPIATAAMPYTSSLWSDIPWRRDGRV